MNTVSSLFAQIVDAAWGGWERPSDDAGILRAIADWMDRLDDVADSVPGMPEQVSRTMQSDLRRIANGLDAHA